MEITAQNLAEVLKSSKNIILHGAPGTGKTHLAMQIAEELGAYYEIVQFHPSYDYTDFVEGLRPVNENNQVVFKRKDGIFKEFCRKAFLNEPFSRDLSDSFYKKFGFHVDIYELLNSQNIDEQIKKFLDSKIYDIMEFYHDSFACDFHKYIFNCKYSTRFYSFEAEYRPKTWYVIGNERYANRIKVIQTMVELFKNPKTECAEKVTQFDIANTIYNYFSKNFVFIIDEINRGEISKIFGELFYLIDPDKRGEKHQLKTQYQNLVEDGDIFKDGFYIPENVYIIATMNDIDRSVEPIDFAFRRRFTWINVKADNTKDEILKELNEIDEDLKNEAEAKMEALNNAIKDLEELDENYFIGASYFLKLKDLLDETKDHSKAFKKLWEYHLLDLLHEYLRGASDITEKIAKLEKAYNDAKPKESSGK